MRTLSALASETTSTSLSESLSGSPPPFHLTFLRDGPLSALVSSSSELDFFLFFASVLFAMMLPNQSLSMQPQVRMKGAKRGERAHVIVSAYLGPHATPSFLPCRTCRSGDKQILESPACVSVRPQHLQLLLSGHQLFGALLGHFDGSQSMLSQDPMRGTDHPKAASTNRA
jgi:hypothetical protein